MGKKRPHRATSKEAHESVKESKSEMYKKIVKGLKRLKIGGNFEEISIASGITPAQCHKRLPEMIELGLVYNVGITRKTSSGRKSMVRQLVGLGYKEITENPKTEKEQKAVKKVKQITQYINQSPLF